jgi:CRP-like cAMP-binding protein
LKVHYQKGDVIFEQGDEAHNFYLVTHGTVEVVVIQGNQTEVGSTATIPRLIGILRVAIAGSW